MRCGRRGSGYLPAQLKQQPLKPVRSEKADVASEGITGGDLGESGSGGIIPGGCLFLSHGQQAAVTGIGRIQIIYDVGTAFGVRLGTTSNNLRGFVVKWPL